MGKNGSITVGLSIQTNPITNPSTIFRGHYRLNILTPHLDACVLTFNPAGGGQWYV